MCTRAAHACAASYRQRQRVPSLLSAPSEYTQHSGSRRRLPQASYSWSVRQDTQHKRKLRPPQRTAALPWPSCASFRRDAPRCGVCSRCLPSLSPQRPLLLFGAARHTRTELLRLLQSRNAGAARAARALSSPCVLLSARQRGLSFRRTRNPCLRTPMRHLCGIPPVPL